MLEEMDTFDGAYTADDEASGLASVNLGRSAFSLNLFINTYCNGAVPNSCFLYSKSISTVAAQTNKQARSAILFSNSIETFKLICRGSKSIAEQIAGYH